MGVESRPPLQGSFWWEARRVARLIIFYWIGLKAGGPDRTGSIPQLAMHTCFEVWGVERTFSLSGKYDF